jgi:hypothetical protein
MEKIKVRGLVLCASWIFFVWGLVVVIKGFYDSFLGEPEANYFSPHKWDFISRSQWFTWSGFEITYGFACIGMFLALRKYASQLPEYVERPVRKTDFEL